MRVCERKQPFTVMVPSALVMVGAPQASVAVALAAGSAAGLQPKLALGGQKVKTGAAASVVQVNIWAQLLLLPQASVAI